MNDVYLIIKENENLIYKLASHYSHYYNINDLYQAGCIGIIKAYKKYDNNSSCKFTSYAYKYILGEMIDFIRKDRNIVLSEDAYKIYKDYVKIKDLLSSKYNREVLFSEVCDYLKIDEKYMLSILESVYIDKSINEEVSFIDSTSDIDDKILLKSGINELCSEEKELIDYRYYQGYTQSETALKMGLSQVSVSRKEKLILNKLKTNLTK